MKTKFNTQRWLSIALGLLLSSSVHAQAGLNEQIIKDPDQIRQQADLAVSAIVDGVPLAPIATTSSSMPTTTTIAPGTITNSNNRTNTTTGASAAPVVDPCANYTRPPSIAVTRPPTSSTMTPTTMATSVNNRQMNTITPTNTNTNTINTNATALPNMTTATATISPTFDELYNLCVVQKRNITFDMSQASKGTLTFTLNEGPSAAPSEETKAPTRAPTTKESSPDSSPSDSSGSSTSKESRPTSPKETRSPRTPRPTTAQPTFGTKPPSTIIIVPSAPTTRGPTARPTTAAPTTSISPSRAPSESPTFAPTVSPSIPPTAMPTISPTNSPTSRPTNSPTNRPTIKQTVSPTVDICTVCPDRSDPGDLSRRFFGTFLTCGELDDFLRGIDHDPACAGYFELDVDGPAYCECPDTFFPRNTCMFGLCGQFGALNPDFLEFDVSGLSCREWDDWARSAYEQAYCDTLVETYGLQDCCSFDLL